VPVSELETMCQAAPHVDAPTFKDLMAAFPSGVAIVTTRDGRDQPMGLTCSSLCGLSLEPPMLLVCLGNGGRTLAAIGERRAFAVNFLAGGGRWLAERFSAGLAAPFEGVAREHTPRHALPAFPGDAHAVAECELRDTFVAGDHTVVVGLVTGVMSPAGPRPAPLLHGLRRYAAYPDLLPNPERRAPLQEPGHD
jgi:flavin reductase (NADH)